MVGARLFNERRSEPIRPIYGCVTTGEVWQFLKLVDQDVLIDRQRLYIDNVSGVLAVLKATIIPDNS